MTKDELKLVLEALKWCHGGEPCGTVEAIAVVEKALAQPKQKPVAWVWVNNKGWLNYGETPHDMFKSSPLYTHPPQRTWHGLTHEEIDYIYTGIRAVHHDVDSDVLCRAIEAKLKEKNT
jgi:hypothetical protein